MAKNSHLHRKVKDVICIRISFRPIHNTHTIIQKLICVIDWMNIEKGNIGSNGLEWRIKARTYTLDLISNLGFIVETWVAIALDFSKHWVTTAYMSIPLPNERQYWPMEDTILVTSVEASEVASSNTIWIKVTVFLRINRLVISAIVLSICQLSLTVYHVLNYKGGLKMSSQEEDAPNPSLIFQQYRPAEALPPLVSYQ